MGLFLVINSQSWLDDANSSERDALTELLFSVHSAALGTVGRRHVGGGGGADSPISRASRTVSKYSKY